MYILTFIFFDGKLEDIRFLTKWQKAFPEFNLLLISTRTQIHYTQVYICARVDSVVVECYYVKN